MNTHPLLAQARQLQESIDLLANYVDPRDALRGEDGELWDPVGAARGSSLYNTRSVPFSTAQEQEQIRCLCRWLAIENEFALCGHQNRISYIVGKGHTYTAVSKSGKDVAKATLDRTQEWLDEWMKRNRWQERQENIVLRNDRDGESFLKYFPGDDGFMLVRFREPEEVYTPNTITAPNVKFGIRQKVDDAETIEGYYINGEFVEAKEIQHRKYNVDMSFPRGLPLFYTSRKNLARAQKILRNMATVIEIQSAIALIRKHTAGLSSGVQSLVTSLATATTTNQATGQTTNYQQFRPGQIIDHGPGTEYDYPIGHLDPSKPVTGLQACLRAVASSTVMAEYMLTSDASNANYSSTLVAEAPPVKNFERLQAKQIMYDMEVIHTAMTHAVDKGLLPAEVLTDVDIDAAAPMLVTRNPTEEVNRDATLNAGGVLSPQTWAARNNLDYKQEQENFRLHQDEIGDFMGAATMPDGGDPQKDGKPGETGGDTKDAKGDE